MRSYVAGRGDMARRRKRKSPRQRASAREAAEPCSTACTRVAQITHFVQEGSDASGQVDNTDVDVAGEVQQVLAAVQGDTEGECGMCLQAHRALVARYVLTQGEDVGLRTRVKMLNILTRDAIVNHSGRTVAGVVSDLKRDYSKVEECPPCSVVEALLKDSHQPQPGGNMHPFVEVFISVALATANLVGYISSGDIDHELSHFPGESITKEADTPAGNTNVLTLVQTCAKYMATLLTLPVVGDIIISDVLVYQMRILTNSTSNGKSVLEYVMDAAMGMVALARSPLGEYTPLRRNNTEKHNYNFLDPSRGLTAIGLLEDFPYYENQHRKLDEFQVRFAQQCAQISYQLFRVFGSLFADAVPKYLSEQSCSHLKIKTGNYNPYSTKDDAPKIDTILGGEYSISDNKEFSDRLEEFNNKYSEILAFVELFEVLPNGKNLTTVGLNFDKADFSAALMAFRQVDKFIGLGGSEPSYRSEFVLANLVNHQLPLDVIYSALDFIKSNFFANVNLKVDDDDDDEEEHGGAVAEVKDIAFKIHNELMWDIVLDAKSLDVITKTNRVWVELPSDATAESGDNDAAENSSKAEELIIKMANDFIQTVFDARVIYSKYAKFGFKYFSFIPTSVFRGALKKLIGFERELNSVLSETLVQYGKDDNIVDSTLNAVMDFYEHTLLMSHKFGINIIIFPNYNILLNAIFSGNGKLVSRTISLIDRYINMGLSETSSFLWELIINENTPSRRNELSKLSNMYQGIKSLLDPNMALLNEVDKSSKRDDTYDVVSAIENVAVNSKRPLSSLESSTYADLHETYTKSLQNHQSKSVIGNMVSQDILLRSDAIRLYFDCINGPLLQGDLWGENMRSVPASIKQSLRNLQELDAEIIRDLCDAIDERGQGKYVGFSKVIASKEDTYAY